tara:strand:- start:11177 stop:12055 length:879 start_codon:yes stop_codon:yes gene_type:complete
MNERTLQDILGKINLDMLYAGKSSGEGSSLVAAMQAQRKLESMPQSGAVQSLTPINPIDLAAETGLTALSSMDNVNPLVAMLAGVLAPKAYSSLRTTNTPALLKKYDIKVNTPLYHNTNLESANLILKKNLIGASNRPEFIRGGGKKGLSTSTTRDSDYSIIPGDAVSSELDIQLILDKKEVSKVRGTKIAPYVYSKVGDIKNNPFMKGKRFYEAEERIYNKSGIPASKIKAMKLRSPGYSGATLKTLIEESSKKNIPLIVEPNSQERVLKLLQTFKPNQKSKILKNIKFAD